MIDWIKLDPKNLPKKQLMAVTLISGALFWVQDKRAKKATAKLTTEKDVIIRSLRNSMRRIIRTKNLQHAKLLARLED